MRKRLVPSPALAVSLAALTVAVGGVAFASIPGPDGVIHACVANGNLVAQVAALKGALRVIDSGESCGAGETPLNFNQTGPPGPAATPASDMPTLYAERTAKSITVGATKKTVFSVKLPAGSYEVRGNVHVTQPDPLKADQRVECSVIGPSKKVITDSTVRETLNAGGGNAAANLAIDTVVVQMPEGTITVVCDDFVAPGAHPAGAAARAHAADASAEGAAVGSPGVLSGNLAQVPVHVPINVCGNSVNVIGLLNPAFGSVCVND